jgi:hypothetical protein
MIMDGSPILNTPSMNGTWIFLQEEMPIENGLVFKVFQTLFKVQLI